MPERRVRELTELFEIARLTAAALDLEATLAATLQPAAPSSPRCSHPPAGLRSPATAAGRRGIGGPGIGFPSGGNGEKATSTA